MKRSLAAVQVSLIVVATSTKAQYLHSELEKNQFRYESLSVSPQRLDRVQAYLSQVRRQGPRVSNLRALSGATLVLECSELISSV